jgi:hypothetical protein
MGVPTLGMMPMVKEKLSQLKKIPSYVLLGLFIVSALICITALRHNNQTMIKLRSQVYTADQNNRDINTALNNLRKYVYAHMNTDLSSGGNSIKPPIQLKYTYQRLQDQQEEAIRRGQTPTPIPAAQYQFDFISPTWSPDLAGWSLVISVLLLLAFLASFGLERLVSSRIKLL